MYDHGFCAYTNGASGKCIAFIPVGQACDASDTRQRCEGMARCAAGTCRLADARTCR